MTRALVVVPSGVALEEAGTVAQRRRATVLLARLSSGWGVASRETLQHARALGLGRVALATVLWEAPAVQASAGELEVRRRLAPGTPFIVVQRAGRPVGVVVRERAGGPPAFALAVGEDLDRVTEPARTFLRVAGELAAAKGWPVVAVGGLVRDLLRGRLAAPAEVDLAVEGDGGAFARELARTLGGTVRAHASFLTASVELGEGRRVDVATTRRERYARPGALPRVEPATLEEDLARRDFSVNAVGLRLDGSRWGEVVDPLGGVRDLVARRLRVLHPLSFVEDPTRMFRAVRLAVRLGFALERTTRRLLGAAARLDAYGALSGDRLRHELGLVLAEREPEVVLSRLGRAGAFRLLAPAYRFPREARDRLARVREHCGRLPLAPETRVSLYLLALARRQGGRDAGAWAARLGLPAIQRAELARAPGEAAALRGELAGVISAESAFRRLRGVTELTAAWASVTSERPRLRRLIGRHLQEWRTTRPLLTGTDLQARGVPPGPVYGRLLEELVVAQVAGRVVDRETARRWLEDVLASSEPGNARDPDERGGPEW